MHTLPIEKIDIKWRSIMKTGNKDKMYMCCCDKFDSGLCSKCILCHIIDKNRIVQANS